ncbi:hypothetical protein C8R44DRAFT_892840 [Mycena epipterygia]|nr:hypothetical protein C8R44DRAFT_892840 [Mycena epipterygia]
MNYTLIHARGQPEGDIKETIISFLDQCFGWVELWNWSHRLERIPTSGTRMWITAFFDLRQITECVLCDDEVRSHAVYMALVQGHTDLARLLMGNRSYIEAPGEYYGSALYFAISKNDEETVRVLLAHIIDFDGPDGTVFRTSASKGDRMMVGQLFEDHIRTVWDREDARALEGCGEIARLLINGHTPLRGRQVTARCGVDIKAKTKPTGREQISTNANRFPRVPYNSRYSAGWGGQTNTLNVDNLPLLPASAMAYLATRLRKVVPDMQHEGRAMQRG